MRGAVWLIVAALWATGSCDVAIGQAAASAAPFLDGLAMAHLAGLEVPPSSFMSPEARRALAKLGEESRHAPPPSGNIAEARAYYDKFNEALVSRARKLYPVRISRQVMNGVRTEVVVPKGGISPRNRNRVLINLHGGAFLWGEGSGGEIESIPIASRGGFEVVTVAYRQGPEYKFPAASEDVAAVYRFLLRTHKSQDIGIYGCSAGGILTAQSISWFAKVHLPMPGAIGTFCGSASPFGGDSTYTAFALTGGQPVPGVREGKLSFSPYFSDVSASDPLVFPTRSKTVLRMFPPTLLIGGSRDFSVSSLFHTQQLLVAAGVDAELHVWDGMWHAFFVDPDLPESKEAYQVIVQFFDEHLGVPRR